MVLSTNWKRPVVPLAELDDVRTIPSIIEAVPYFILRLWFVRSGRPSTTSRNVDPHVGHRAYGQRRLSHLDSVNQLGHAWATGGPQSLHSSTDDHSASGRIVARIHALQLRQMDCLTVAWATRNPRKSLILVRLAGIEPTTLGFGGQYSIH